MSLGRTGGKRHARSSRERSLAATSAIIALLLILLSPKAVVAQSAASEVWQVVGSLPTIPNSGLPSVSSPNPTMAFPTGVATTGSGDVVIADSGNQRVRVFDAATGTEALTLGVTGRKFYWPMGVKVDACGHILVTDYGHSELRIFNSDGTELSTNLSGLSDPWGLALAPGTVVGQACTDASGTALAPQGTLAVVNSLSSDGTGGGSVAVYDGSLNLQFTFGASGGGKLQAPIGVAIDPSTGNFFVTDAGTPPSIKVFDPTGVFLFSFTDSSLSFPNDIAFDASGRVFVTDSGTQRIDLFAVHYNSATPSSSTASFLFDLTQSNTPGDFPFLAPSGLAFDDAGELLVTTGTYDPDDPLAGPLDGTQYLLAFDRPSLAITAVTSSSGSLAVAPGTPLTFTVTAIASTGEVRDAAIAGTLTAADGTQVSLGTISPGTIVAGTPATATFTYTVPASITANTSVSFSASATGTVDNGTATTAVSAPDFAPVVVPVVITGDMTPPVTTAGTPGDQGGWFKTSVTVTLTAADEAGGSGIAELDYQFSGPQQLLDPFLHRVAASTGQLTLSATPAITQDAATASTLTYWAVDKAGNTETRHTLSLQVDRTPPYATWGSPVPSATSPAGAPARWWNTSVRVPFTAVDRGSGVTSFTPSIGYVSFSSEGAHQSQTVSITDAAGNTSDATNGINRSPEINIDLHAPTVTSITVAPSPNANGWNNTQVQVTFAASDNLSGFPGVDAASSVSGDTNGRRVLTFGLEGRHQTAASQTFTDLAGNVSAPATYSTPISIDLTPPVITSTSDLNTANLSQSIAPNANGWFNGLVTVQITATDNLSGFAAGDASTGQAGSLNGLKRLAFGEGRHAASSFAISDLAGNSASTAVADVNIDLTSPAVAAPIVLDAATGLTVSPSNGWYRADHGAITVSFTATDALSGFSGGATTQTQSFPLANDQANQTVSVPVFTDLAGNSSTGYSGNPAATTLSGLNVDSTPPTVVVTASGTPAYVTPDRTWYNAPVVVTFTATDALSGFAAGAQTSITTTLPEGVDRSASQSFEDLAGNAAAGAFGPVSIDTTPPTLTANVSANGSTETITYRVSETGSGLASCRVDVDGVVVQQTCDTPLQFAPSDSGKVVTATAIDQVGNRTVVPTTISFAPPEAYNQFDPVTHDVLVYGFDPVTGESLGVITPMPIVLSGTDEMFGRDAEGRFFGPFPAAWLKLFGGIGGRDLRFYRIAGTGENALTLIESVKAAGHEIEVRVVGFQYTVNGETEPFIFAPDATKRFEWADDQDGHIRNLNQTMTIGHGRGGVEVEARYRRESDRTTVQVEAAGGDTSVTLAGLVLLRMATHRPGSNLIISADGLTPVQGISGWTAPFTSGFSLQPGAPTSGAPVTSGSGSDGSGSGAPDSGSEPPNPDSTPPHASNDDHQGNDGDHHGSEDDDHHGNDGDHHDDDQHGNNADHLDTDHHRDDADRDTHGRDEAHAHDTDHDETANHAPAIAFSDLANREGEIVAVQVAAVDPDGDPMTYAAIGLPPGLAMSASGQIAGVLPFTSAGEYRVTVTATDPKGATGSGRFVWNVTNVDRAPTLAVVDLSSDEGDIIAVQVSGSDADGDTLTYTATGLPPGLRIDGATGEISGTPGTGSRGTYSVTVTVTDGHLESSAAFQWTVKKGK